MIMVQEEALLKGREQFERLVNLVRQAPRTDSGSTPWNES